MLYVVCHYQPNTYCGSCRLQYKTTGTALNNALKTKNQDTNGETYAENKLSHSHKKKVLNLSRVPVYFSLSEDSFTKMSCQGLFCSVQLSWAEFNCKLVHFHSN